eukprot:3826608-Pyramimonas_sp.AAC.1
MSTPLGRSGASHRQEGASALGGPRRGLPPGPVCPRSSSLGPPSPLVEKDGRVGRLRERAGD